MHSTWAVSRNWYKFVVDVKIRVTSRVSLLRLSRRGCIRGSSSRFHRFLLKILKHLKKYHPKILIRSSSTSDQRCTPLTKGVPAASPRDIVARYKGIPLYPFVSGDHNPRFRRWDTFCVRDASLEGRRSAKNQYFLWDFFKVL